MRQFWAKLLYKLRLRFLKTLHYTACLRTLLWRRNAHSKLIMLNKCLLQTQQSRHTLHFICRKASC